MLKQILISTAIVSCLSGCGDADRGYSGFLKAKGTTEQLGLSALILSNAEMVRNEIGRGSPKKIQSRIDGPSWVAVKTYECWNTGVSLKILKNTGQPNSQGYRYAITTDSTLTEHSDLVRRDLLSSWYGAEQGWSTQLVESNANRGDYCGFGGTWITGKVFTSTYPNPVKITHYSEITRFGNDPIDFKTANEAFIHYNQSRSGSEPQIPACSAQICSTSTKVPSHSGNGPYKTLDDMEKAMVKKHNKRAKKRGGVISTPNDVNSPSAVSKSETSKVD